MGNIDRKEEIWMACKDECVAILAADAQGFHKDANRVAGIADEFLRHFSALFQLLKAQQDRGEKGALRHVTLSLLLSGIVAETYELATTCHTANVFLDDVETESYWAMGFLKEMVDNGVASVLPQLKRKVFRLRKHEIEEFRTRYALTYTPILLSFFQRELRRIYELPEFMDVQKDDVVEVALGGYMEQAATLLRYGEGNS